MIPALARSWRGASASGAGIFARPLPSARARASPPMIEPFLGRHPDLHPSAWVAPSAIVAGDVTLGEGASVWYGASLRGDVHYIRVGDRSNVQDNAVLHVSRETHPCVLGEDVTVGHSAVVHGCTVEDGCLIGMGAVVLDGAVIGAGSTVGAGALVTGGTQVPPRSLVLGAPARVVRGLTDEEVAANLANAAHYVRLTRMYAGHDRPSENPFYVRPPRGPGAE
jgi:gamma-carbonic anhydrase